MCISHAAVECFLSRFRLRKSQSQPFAAFDTSPWPPRSSRGRRPWTRTAGAPERRRGPGAAPQGAARGADLRGLPQRAAAWGGAEGRGVGPLHPGRRPLGQRVRPSAVVRCGLGRRRGSWRGSTSTRTAAAWSASSF